MYELLIELYFKSPFFVSSIFPFYLNFLIQIFLIFSVLLIKNSNFLLRIIVLMKILRIYISIGKIKIFIKQSRYS